MKSTSNAPQIKMSDEQDPVNPGTPSNVTMHRGGGLGQPGIEGAPTGTRAAANQLTELMNELALR